MMRTVWTIVAIAFALLAAPAAAQEASPTPDVHYAGELLKAERYFENQRLVGTAVLQCQVVLFDTPEHASAAITTYVDSLKTSPLISEINETSAPTYFDETHTYAVTIVNEGVTVTAGILIVRDGAVIHNWIAYALAGDVFADLFAIADTVFARPPATPTANGEADLMARLPTLADVPPGFTVAAEQIKPGDDAATPTA